MSAPLASLRQDYDRGSLSESDVSADPIDQMKQWLDEALAAEEREATAMALATADAKGHPSVRMVLLKGLDEHGFVFNTNRESRKGRQLSVTPIASLVFWWPKLERQVRVEGRVEQTSEEEADVYFGSRPRGSKIGAWVSQQSQPIEGREHLLQILDTVEAKFEGSDDIPRPTYWGGFRVIPDRIEFWQGRPSRLHDRLEYRRAEQGGWIIRRLAP